MIALVALFLLISPSSLEGSGCRDHIRDILRSPSSLQKIYGVDAGPVIAEPTSEAISKVHAIWKKRGYRPNALISKLEMKSLETESQLSREDLMVALAKVVSGYSHPPISEYPVGVVGETTDGDFLFGVNHEIGAFPLNGTLHGEQVLTINALSRGKKLKSIALSAAPCGHCRQFLNETFRGSDLKMAFPGIASGLPLSILLPLDFGPIDLGIETGELLAHTSFKLSLEDPSSDPLVNEALKAAQKSYAPYTQAPAGVAIQTIDGRIYTGSPYVENVGFNPSAGPLEAGLALYVLEHAEWAEHPASKRTTFQDIYREISRVVLVERSSSSPKDPKNKMRPAFGPVSRLIISQIAPQASFETYTLNEPQK